MTAPACSRFELICYTLGSVAEFITMRSAYLTFLRCSDCDIESSITFRSSKALLALVRDAGPAVISAELHLAPGEDCDELFTELQMLLDRARNRMPAADAVIAKAMAAR